MAMNCLFGHLKRKHIVLVVILFTVLLLLSPLAHKWMQRDNLKLTNQQQDNELEIGKYDGRKSATLYNGRNRDRKRIFSNSQNNGNSVILYQDHNGHNNLLMNKNVTVNQTLKGNNNNTTLNQIQVLYQDHNGINNILLMNNNVALNQTLNQNQTPQNNNATLNQILYQDHSGTNNNSLKNNNATLNQTLIRNQPPQSNKATKERDKKHQFCEEQKHIIFLKAHKVAGTTVANILQRYGVRNNLTFLLPLPGQFGIKWKDLPPNKHYDILACHSHHNPDEWRQHFPRDAVKITILREPLAQLQSHIYFKMYEEIPYNDKLSAFLANPEKHNRKNGKRRNFLHQTSQFLGVPEGKSHDLPWLANYTRQLDTIYRLVMITELFNESLVLLRRYLCWRTQDIIHIPININSRKPKLLSIPDKLREKHRKLAESEYYLYNFFYDKLMRQIKSEGAGFYKEVQQFKIILENVKSYCDSKENGSLRWNEEFNVTRSDCENMRLKGGKDLEWLRQYQYPQHTVYDT